MNETGGENLTRESHDESRALYSTFKWRRLKSWIETLSKRKLCNFSRWTYNIDDENRV